ncbi:unnamed protein product, partial [Amoebophrya sp. A120]|eukprot:GSA120T00015122001.1
MLTGRKIHWLEEARKRLKTQAKKDPTKLKYYTQLLKECTTKNIEAAFDTRTMAFSNDFCSLFLPARGKIFELREYDMWGGPQGVSKSVFPEFENF